MWTIATWGRFLRLFTDLPIARIVQLEALRGAAINEAKITLANAVTGLVRGEAAARSAEATAARTFDAGDLGAGLPSITLPPGGLRIGAMLTELGFTASNAEAKRKIAEGAVRLDDAPVNDAGMLVVPEASDRKLSLGRKKHAIVSSQ